MCGTEIDWSAFSWEAFATLTTGLLAVIAAAYVGSRQAIISERQADIIDRQAHLAELTLRSELFERRLECYQQIRGFLAFIISQADVPDNDNYVDFLNGILSSRFLFKENVFSNLSEIKKEAEDYMAVKKITNATFKREGNYEPELDREHELHNILTKRLESLFELFIPEMQLSAYCD